MCAVSMIFDYGSEKEWWKRVDPPNPVVNPFVIKEDKTLEMLKEIVDLLKKAEKTDEVNGEPDCGYKELSDLYKALEDRVAELEKKDRKGKGRGRRNSPAK